MTSISPAWALWSQLGLVVVDDFDTFGSSVFPDETYTPLHVNGNAVLPGPIAGQRVKAVRGRIAKIVERLGAIEQPQLVNCPRLNVRGSLRLRKPFQISSVSTLVKLRIIQLTPEIGVAESKQI